MLSARKVLQGSASNIIRLVFSLLVGIVLPRVLVHHLSQAEYSAWVLILQLSTYVSLLDLGLQTVVAKFVAEHHATGDREANWRLISSSFSVLSIAAVIGMGIVAFMVWRVPHFFAQMPPSLYPQVRIGLLAVGLSAAIALPFGPFLSAFAGLQEYFFPTLVGLVSRVAMAMALIGFTFAHASLAELACVMAAVNVLTALAQYLGWKRYASHQLDFTFFYLDRSAASNLLRSGGVIAIWTIGGLFVSGLDTIIVGHFDFAHTGFYALAASVTNFMLMFIGSLFSPLMPAVSAMQATSTPKQVGDLTIRVSRYCTLVVCIAGLPLLVAAYPLLTLWVGRQYALQTTAFLQILVLGNCIRQLGYPYSLIVIATGKQYFATIASVAEAVVNLTLSIWLAHRIGAMGVAIGTLVGAFVSVGLHLLVSMPLTRPAIQLTVGNFFSQSFLRPLLCTTPLLLLIPSWNRSSLVPANPIFIVLWVVATLALMYTVGLSADDRHDLKRYINKLVLLRAKA